jgi:hypothetical protein
MSVEVPIDQLFVDLHLWGSGFLATVSDDGRARIVCLTPTVDQAGNESVLRFRRAGRTAAANIAARPNVTVVFPAHFGSAGYSLIVDGIASNHDVDEVPVIDLVPTWAVLHRPAP